MTHVAWVPPEWLDAAERTLEGMAERHPSRTVMLVPRPDEADGLDAELSVRCFPIGDRAVCGEVIELQLRGDRALAPASLVLPLADLGPAGVPALARRAAVRRDRSGSSSSTSPTG